MPADSEDFHDPSGGFVVHILVLLAEELIGLHVAVLVATGGAHLAAKAATASVPIVCGLGADPIKFGLAESIKRPLATISTPNCLFDGALKRGLWRYGRVSPCMGSPERRRPPPCVS